MAEYIQLVDVGFRYEAKGRHSDWVVKDLDLSVHKREFHVLVGRSGSGKTTILNLVAGFESPTRGEIRVAQRVVTKPGIDRVMIFQGDDSLYPWLTAAENVEFGLRIAGMPPAKRRERALEYLDLVGLGGQGSKFPFQLSGGMKQRVQLARALASQTDILLMDEPFGALDAQTRSVLQVELSGLWERTGCTILFVTHDLAEAIVLADRVSIMTPGPAARIKETLPIPLRRPRSFSQPEFAPVYAQLNSLLNGRSHRNGQERLRRVTWSILPVGHNLFVGRRGGPPMTPEDSMQAFRLRLMARAKALGNVGQARWKSGISRSLFHR